MKDAQPLTLPSKDLGSTEIYPQTLLHSPNGRFVAVCGDGEYIIYTALALRNQAFGSALDFVWASKENDREYAIRESALSVKIFRNFKERATVNVGFQAEGLSGGVLLGVKGQGGIGLFDWETGQLVRRIEVDPKSVSVILKDCCIAFTDQIVGLLVGKWRARHSCLRRYLLRFTIFKRSLRCRATSW